MLLKGKNTIYYYLERLEYCLSDNKDNIYIIHIIINIKLIPFSKNCPLCCSIMVFRLSAVKKIIRTGQILVYLISETVIL